MTRKQNYVTFYSPGTLISESSSEPIESWDSRVAVGMSEKIVERHGAKPYGFRFETRIVADPIPDGTGGTLNVESKTIKTSGMHFLGGKLYTLAEAIERNLEDERILRDNMRCNDYPIVCINTNSWKSVNPFEAEDFIVGPDGSVVERGDDPKRVAYRAAEKINKEKYYADLQAKWKAEAEAKKSRN